MFVMNKAVFLDRDGVINEHVEHLHKLEDLRILPGVGGAIKALNQKGYHVIVISNQAAVAKGIATIDEVETLHREMKKNLAEDEAMLDGIYYCPHHPEGIIAEYSIACHCRKPETGMIEEAVGDFDIDLGRSFFVGDSTGDILAGKRAGVKTILVKTGYAGKDGLHEVTPDFVAADLVEAINYIL